MSTHSTDGRPWAKLSSLNPGDKVILDGGFAHTDCALPANTIRTIKINDRGELYFECGAGPHLLEGQLSAEDNDSLVGLWPAP